MLKITHILSVAFVASAMLFAVPAQGGEARAQSIEVAVSQHPMVQVKGDRVEITVHGDSAERIDVYSLTGRLVKSLDAQPGTQQIELPAGYYIVKCARHSQRIIVK